MTRRSVAGRRATAGVIGLAVLAALALGGCSQSNTPTEYNTLTRQNFLETCTNYYFDNTDDTLAITSNTVKADITAPDENTCQCMYEVFSGPNGDGVGGMPINSETAKTIPNYTGPNFTDLNSELKADPQKAWDGVPEDVKSQIDDCNATKGGTSSSTSTSTTAAQSTTTTAAP